MKTQQNTRTNVILAALVAVIVFLLYERCENPKTRLEEEKGIIKVDSAKVQGTTKEVKTTFEPVENPKPIIINNYYPKDNSKQDAYIRELIKELSGKEQIDSAAIAKAFLEATKIREYEETFEDSLSKTVVSSKVQGTLLNQKIDQTIKPQVFEYYEKTYTKLPKYRILASFKAESNIINSDAKIGLGFQNQKGKIYTAGYSPFTQTFEAGFYLPIFTKK